MQDIIVIQPIFKIPFLGRNILTNECLRACHNCYTIFTYKKSKCNCVHITNEHEFLRLPQNHCYLNQSDKLEEIA